MYVEDVEDRSNTPKGCNAMYVGDVEDVKDRSNTPKGCNTMYVEDVEDRSNTPMYVKACRKCRRLSSTSSTCFNIHSV